MGVTTINSLAQDSPCENYTMKFLVLFALFALALAEPEAEPEAKADPAAWYGYGGYGGMYRGYGLGYRYFYGGYGGYGHYIGKRSADAEPEAEANPEAWYGTRWGGRYGYGGYPYSYGGNYRYGGYPYSYGYRGYW